MLTVVALFVSILTTIATEVPHGEDVGMSGPLAGQDSVGLQAVLGTGPAAPIKFTDFGLADGLPSIAISALTYAPDGLLWVGTGGGCVTFDGKRFRAVGPSRDRGYSTAERASSENRVEDVMRVRALLTDSSGSVWVGGGHGKLLRYASESSVPSVVPTQQIHISALFEDRSGVVWIGGSRLERAELAGDELRVKSVLEAPDDRPLQITSITEAPDSAVKGAGGRDTVGSPPAVYVSSSHGLFRWTQSGGLEHLHGQPSKAVFFDSTGRRWEVHPDHRILVDGRITQTWPSEPGEFQGALPVADGGTLLSFSQGLILHQPQSPWLRSVRMGGPPRALLAGPGDGIWIASDPNGLRFVERQDYDSYPSTQLEHQPDAVAAIGPDTFFTGSGSHALARLIRFSNATTEVTPISSMETPLALRGFHDAASGGDGVQYVGTDRGVLLLQDLMEGRDHVAAFDGAHVKELMRGPGGSVWATLHDGIHELRGGSATGRSFTKFGGSFDALELVGDVILAARRNSLFRFDLATNSADQVATIEGVEIRDLFAEHDEDVWATTYGSGLYRLRLSRDGTVTRRGHWGLDEGLPDPCLGWIGSVPGRTAETHMWMSSNRGVLAISRESLETTWSDPGERLQCWIMDTSESKGTAAAALQSGHLAVATMSGLAVIDANQPLHHPEPPRLSLAGIWGNGVLLTGFSKLVGASDVDFEFDAASFPRDRGSVVEYRLAGHDDRWRGAGEERTARYINLPEGKYTFQLRGRSIGATSGTSIESERIEIIPHWYQRSSTRLLFGALIAACLGLVLRQRLVSARTHRQALELRMESQQRITELRRQLSETEEHERSRIARELHDDLSQRIAAIALRLESVASGSVPMDDERFAQVLYSIQVSIRDLALDVHGFSRRLHPTVLDDLGLVAALRSECARRGRLAEFSVDFQHDGTAKDLKGDVGLALFRIVQESLQNVASHAQATSAGVRLFLERNQLVLEIEDDGRGLPGDGPTGPGMGLVSMSERMQLVGGHFEIGRAKDGGTVVRAAVPAPHLD